MEKKITIIIPNYNGIEYMENCLKSLTLQSCTDFKVLVVDNGSYDGSRELVENEYPETELFCLEENLGFCMAVNAGICRANTPFVLLLNNDTTVHRDFVMNLLTAIEKDEKIFSVGAKMLSMKEPDKIDDAGNLYCALGWAFALGKGKKADNYDRPSRIFAACGGAAIYRRSLFREIGYFDENHFAYLEDIDIGYRADIYGYTNYYEPAAIVYHAGSGFSGSRYNEFKIRLSSKNSVYMIYKNMPILQVILNLPFLMIGYLMKIVFFSLRGYGYLYIQGVFKGIGMGFTKSGKAHKVPFRWKHLGAYCRIQLDLWWNMIRRLAG